MELDSRLPAQHLGELFRHRSYGVDPSTFLLGYEDIRRRAHEERPLILIAGFGRYPRLVFPGIAGDARMISATFMVDMAHFAGLVAGKVFTGEYDPVPHAHRHDYNPQDLTYGPRRTIPVPQGTRGVRRCGCPVLGRSPSPRDGSQGRRVDPSVAAALPGLCGGGCRQRDIPRRRAYGRGCSVVTAGTDNLVLLDVRHFGPTDDKPSPACRAAALR